MVTVLTDTGSREVDGEPRGDDLWLRLDAVEAATGWSLTSEGFCRGDVCVPTPPGREAEFVRGDTVNVAAFWRHRGGPVLRDAAGRVFLFAEPAASRTAHLESLEAPDFALPDLEGKLHTLSSQRGKKVLLVTWASW